MIELKHWTPADEGFQLDCYLFSRCIIIFFIYLFISSWKWNVRKIDLFPLHFSGNVFFNKFSIETSLHLFPSANTIVSYGISLAGSELKVEFHIRTVRHSSLLSFHFWSNKKAVPNCHKFPISYSTFACKQIGWKILFS